MKKMILILMVIAVLLSGCISGGSKSGNSKAGSNGDEYGADNSVEESDSGVVQAEYGDLDLNNKVLNGSNMQNIAHENIKNIAVGNVATNAS